MILSVLPVAGLAWWVGSVGWRWYGDHVARAAEIGERTESWLRSLDRHDAANVHVKTTSWSNLGDRATLLMSDGAVLTLRCFWPRPVGVVRLSHASFSSQVGWQLVFDAANGDPVTVWAWSVRHVDAPAAPYEVATSRPR